MSRRRKRSRRRVEVTLNMDSFIDVMSNSVGVLTIILLFAAVVTSRTQTLIPTWEMLPEKRINNFEILKGRILYVDNYGILSAVIEHVKKLVEMNGDDRLEALANLQIVHGSYRVLPEAIPAGVIKVVPTGTGGTPVDQLAKPESEFSTVLKGLDPAKDLILFIIRFGGWEAYPPARRIAQERGFQTSYEIRTDDSPITFTIGAAAIAGGLK